MAKRVAVVQSNYIPWKGYFDLIRCVDEFVLYDDAQYTKNDWRNRNIIKTAQGPRWLTIPVRVTGAFPQKISAASIPGPHWRADHWKTLCQSYSKAPHFRRYRDLFEDLYMNCDLTLLSLVNRRFLDAVCGLLGIATPLRWSSEFALEGDATEKVLGLCRQLGATSYLSGPTAKAYLEEDRFREAGIEVQYADYSGYPEYPQLHPPFDHRVSVLDLLFCVGDEAPRYLKKV